MTTPETYSLIEKIRAELRELDFTPLSDAELARKREAMADAEQNNAIEDLASPPEELALGEMLLEERAPHSVHEFAVRRYLEETMREPLRGEIFPDNPY